MGKPRPPANITNSVQRTTPKKSRPESRVESQSIVKREAALTGASKLQKFAAQLWRKAKSISVTAYALITLFTTLTGYSLISLLTPRLELTATSSLDAKAPFQTIFELKNNGVFSISETKLSMIEDTIATANGATIVGLTFKMPTGVDLTIKGGQISSFQFNVEQFFSFARNNIVYADVGLVVDYDYLWVKHQDAFFYRIVRGSDEYIWVRKQENEWAKKFLDYKNK